MTNGQKGLRVGEVIAKQLANYPGEIVVVHHMWNTKDKLVLQIERRDPTCRSVSFERVVL